MITNKGRMKLVRALSPDETLNVSQIWVTNDPAAPAVTDTTLEFCDGSTYDCEQLTITQTYPSGNLMYFEAVAGLDECNFIDPGTGLPVQWEKIGLVDEDGILIATKVYNKTKDNTMQELIQFDLEVS